MKHLTKSDLINIEAFKGLINMVSNDIKEVKQGTAEPSEKANKIIQLYRQRINLIIQASDKYGHINWLDETLSPNTDNKRMLTDTIKANIFTRLNLN